MAVEVVVTARLRDELSKGLEQIRTEVGKVTDTVRSAGAAAGRGGGWDRYTSRLERAMQHTSRFSDAYDNAMDGLTTTRLDLAGAGLLAAFGGASLAAMRFEERMSGVQAATSANAATMSALTDAALSAGQATSFSASEAAVAETELAKAGVSTAAILSGALAGAMDLAAAGSVSLGRAAEIAAASLNMFHLQASDTTMVADTLAAGANKSAADIDGLAQAMAMGGGVAASYGLSIQDTIASLALFADQGYQGSDAGTMLKTTLMRLTPASGEAAAAMSRYNLAFYDAQGQFVGMSEVARQLQGALGGVSAEQRNTALATIFGADAVRAANVLVDEGASGWNEYRSAVDDAGAASRVAATLTDNLAGDLERLSGTIETGLIKAGSGTNGALRIATQGATGMVETLNAMPGPLLSVAVGLTGVAGAALLVAPRVLAAKAAYDALAVSSPRAAATTRGLGKALGGFAAAAAIGATVRAVTAGMDEVGASADETAMRLRAAVAGGTLDELVAGMQGWQTVGFTFADTVDRVTDPSLWDRVNDVGGSLVGIFGVGDGRGGFQRQEALSALDQLDAGLANLVAGGNAQAAADSFQQMLAASGKSVEDLATVMPQYGAALSSTANQAGQVTSALDLMRDAADGAASAVDRTAASLAASGSWLTQENNLLSYREALLSAERAVESNGRATNLHTAAGVANRRALLGVAAAARQAYTVADEAGNVTVRNTAAYERSAAAFYGQARAMGSSSAAALRLTRKAYGASFAVSGLGRAKASPRIAADTRGLHSKVGEARALLRRLEARPASPRIEARIEEAQARVRRLSGQLDTLRGKETKPKVDADTAAATDKVNAYRQSLDALNGKTANTYIHQHLITSHESAGDTASPALTRLPAVTGVPLEALGMTLARHDALAGRAGGGFRVTNAWVGGAGRGRGSGDHQAGRAVDVQGPRLGAYAQAVRDAGGFAEFHGAGRGRHVHAVLGDTASPARIAPSQVPGPVQVGPFYFTGVTGQDQASIKATVRAGVREYLAERVRRGV